MPVGYKIERAGSKKKGLQAGTPGAWVRCDGVVTTHPLADRGDLLAMD